MKIHVLLAFREPCQRTNCKETATFVMLFRVAYLICFTVVIERVRENDDLLPKLEVSGWEKGLHHDD